MWAMLRAVRNGQRTATAVGPGPHPDLPPRRPDAHEARASPSEPMNRAQASTRALTLQQLPGATVHRLPRLPGSRGPAAPPRRQPSHAVGWPGGLAPLPDRRHRRPIRAIRAIAVFSPYSRHIAQKVRFNLGRACPTNRCLPRARQRTCSMSAGTPSPAGFASVSCRRSDCRAAATASAGRMSRGCCARQTKPESSPASALRRTRSHGPPRQASRQDWLEPTDRVCRSPQFRRSSILETLDERGRFASLPGDAGPA
jgi:hypothetical protein